MLGRKEELSLQLNQILDSFLIAFALWFSHWLRFNGTEWWDLRPIAPFGDFLWVMAIVVPFTPLILEFQSFYAQPLQKSGWDSLRQMFQAMVYVGVIIGACVIFLKWEPESRSVFIIFGALTGMLLLGRVRLHREFLRRKLLQGQLKHPVVLLGLIQDIDAVYSNIPLEQRLEMNVVAKLDITQTTTAELIRILHDHSVARVILAAEHIHFSEVESALAACEAEGVEVWLAADFFQTSIARPDFEMVGGRPMLVFRSTPEVSWALLFKNGLDRIFALLLIIATSPFWLIAAVGIKMSSQGPVFFRQERGGLYGKPFRMFKFRTMRADAEALRAALENENQMSGPVFKLDRDPRVFSFGKFLRRTSIDELPQLINVAMGQMSLVGPRPLPVYEVAQIELSSQRRRLSVKPGITCLWQVGGRNRIKDFDEWVALDLEYIDNWSLWLDFKILFKTLPVVFLGAGAQ